MVQGLSTAEEMMDVVKPQAHVSAQDLHQEGELQALWKQPVETQHRLQAVGAPPRLSEPVLFVERPPEVLQESKAYLRLRDGSHLTLGTNTMEPRSGLAFHRCVL